MRKPRRKKSKSFWSWDSIYIFFPNAQETFVKTEDHTLYRETKKLKESKPSTIMFSDHKEWNYYHPHSKDKVLLRFRGWGTCPGSQSSSVGLKTFEPKSIQMDFALSFA